MVVLTPDGPSVIEHYLELMSSLRKEFRVVCFDMPGFGFSFPSLTHGFGIVQTADMIAQLLDTLAIPRCALAFSCANGFFALSFAKRHPQRVMRLLLAQTPSLAAMSRWTDRVVPKPLRVPFVGQMLMATQRKKLASGWFDAALPRDNAMKPFFKQHAHHAVTEGGCFCLASLVQGLAPAKDADLQGIDCPVLLIHGNRDPSHKYTDFQSIHDIVPQASIVTYSGCGHLPDLERQADYADTLKQFVLTA